MRRLARLMRRRHLNAEGSRKAAFLRKRLALLARAFNPISGKWRSVAFGIGGVLPFAAATVFAQTPSITGLTPKANSFGIARSSDIRINFSTTMDAATMTAANIRIFGSQTGFLSTSGTYSGNQERVFDPTLRFKPGEEIMVTVTGANSSGGTALTQATVYSFRAEVQGGTGVFNSSNFGSGSSSHDIALGDLDGDGDLDAIIANYSDEPQEIWLNNGDGSFNSSTFSSGNSTDVVLGDLDGDGDLDAVVTNNLGTSSEIWLNNGDGSFVSSSFGGGGSFGAALGDLDGDGDLDAVIARAFNLKSAIWLNNGDGSFISSEFGATRISQDVALGDLDGDGDLDAVVANYFGNNGQEVWLNNGDATFTSSGFGGRNSTNVALGDLDGDGDLDALIANRSGANQQNYLCLNDGSGVFTTSNFGSSWSEDIAIGDVDGDSDLDVVIANSAFGTSKIWLNNGDATFNSKSLGFGKSTGVAFGDVDGDGDLDILMSVDDAAQRMHINQPPPHIAGLAPAANAFDVPRDADISISFDQEMNTASLAADPLPTQANIIIYGMQSGHIATTASFNYSNGDMTVEIDPAAEFKAGEQIMLTVTAASNSDGIAITQATVYSFRAAAEGGTGQFAGGSFGGSASARGCAVGDLDGDEDLDAIIAISGQAQEVWLNQGGGNFSSSTFGGGNTEDVALGDLDGDGDLDAVFAETSSLGGNIWLNNGDASFVSSNFGAGSNTDVALGDLDGDGDLDAIVARAAGQASAIWLNNGDGSFTSGTAGDTRTSTALALGDLDGDGDLDAVIANGFGQPQEILLNKGNAVFCATTFDAGDNSEDVALGDLDGDGDLDAVFANFGSAEQKLWLNNGDASFALHTVTGGGNSLAVDIGDLDGDGDLDIAIANSSQAKQFLLNNGDASFTSTGFASGKSRAVALGDVDGDGDLDAVFANLGQAGEILLNLPPPPTITGMTPTSVLAGPGGLNLAIDGTHFESTGAQISLLDAGGSPIGMRDLVLSSSTATSFAAQIPAGLLATAGTLTLTVSNPSASTSTTLTVHPLISITGATCGCPDQLTVYSALPTSATAGHVWSLAGGQIVGGQGSGSVQVVWDQGAAHSISVTRSYAGCCTTADVLSVAPETLNTIMDYAVLATNAIATLAVLANDSGAGLTLTGVENSGDGFPFVTSNTILYGSNPELAGVDLLSYTVMSSKGCTASGAVLIAVEGPAAIVNGEFIEWHKDRAGGVRGLRSAHAVASSPDERYVYVAGRNDHSIVIFERDNEVDTLRYIGRVRNGLGGINGLKYVSDIALSPDGKHLYAAGYGNNAVAVFAVDQLSGSLNFIESLVRGQTSGGLTIDGLTRPRSLTVSPDGKNVYAAGYVSNTVAVFRRLSNGTLQYVERHKDGSGGVDGLARVIDLAVSPDGKHVYAAGFADNALAVFNRSLSDGSLSFVERRKDGSGGIDGLAGISAVALSPDGKHVYTSGKNDRALALFTRNVTTGSLTWQARYKDGSGGVDGLNGVSGLAVSPDGRQVWAIGATDDALVLFDRDPAAGTLNYVESLHDGVGGVNGLDQAQALVVSPSGREIFVASSRDNALSYFLRNFAPRAVDDVVGGVVVNSSKVISAINNDRDSDDHGLTISATTGATLGTVTISGGGLTLRYVAGAAPGEDSFSYTVEDGHGGTSTATVKLNVTLSKAGAGEEVVPGPGRQRGTDADNTVIADLRVTPNPASADPTVAFRLHRAAPLRLRIVDLSGLVVRETIRRTLQPGEYRLALDGQGSEVRLPAGSYIVELQAQESDGASLKVVVPLVIIP